MVVLYGFIHPYSILTVVSATACNYRGYVPIELANPIVCEHVYFYFVIKYLVLRIL